MKSSKPLDLEALSDDLTPKNWERQRPKQVKPECVYFLLKHGTKILTLAFVVCVVASIASVLSSSNTSSPAPTSPTPTPPPSPCTYTSTFFDDFSTLSSSSWTVLDLATSHNDELQYYTSRPENVRISNSNLHITPRRESYGDKSWTSARINSKSKQSFTYGKFTIRAQLPSGKGLWSALWMLPEEDYYGTWAASGEIDIMEGDGATPTKVSSALHYSDVWPYNTHVATGLAEPAVCGDGDPAIDYSDGLHDFVLYWNRDFMTFAVDGFVSWTVPLNKDWYVPMDGSSDRYTAPRQPWDRAFYFVFNVAVGGWFLDDPTQEDAAAWSSPEMIIDYVRVEQREGDADGVCEHADDQTLEPVFQSVCSVKDGVAEGDLEGALSWVCGQTGNIVDCSGFSGSTTQRSNLAFNKYWEQNGREATGCCFGEADGLSNCKAAIVCKR